MSLEERSAFSSKTTTYVSSQSSALSKSSRNRNEQRDSVSSVEASAAELRSVHDSSTLGSEADVKILPQFQQRTATSASSKTEMDKAFSTGDLSECTRKSLKMKRGEILCDIRHIDEYNSLLQVEGWNETTKAVKMDQDRPYGGYCIRNGKRNVAEDAKKLKVSSREKAVVEVARGLSVAEKKEKKQELLQCYDLNAKNMLTSFESRTEGELDPEKECLKLHALDKSDISSFIPDEEQISKQPVFLPQSELQKAKEEKLPLAEVQNAIPINEGSLFAQKPVEVQQKQYTATPFITCEHQEVTLKDASLPLPTRVWKKPCTTDTLSSEILTIPKPEPLEQIKFPEADDIPEMKHPRKKEEKAFVAVARAQSVTSFSPTSIFTGAEASVVVADPTQQEREMTRMESKSEECGLKEKSKGPETVTVALEQTSGPHDKGRKVTKMISERKETDEDIQKQKDLEKDSGERKEDGRKPVVHAHALALGSSPAEKVVVQAPSSQRYKFDAKSETKTGKLPNKLEILEEGKDQMEIQPKEETVLQMQKEVPTQKDGKEFLVEAKAGLTSFTSTGIFAAAAASLVVADQRFKQEEMVRTERESKELLGVLKQEWDEPETETVMAVEQTSERDDEGKETGEEDSREQEDSTVKKDGKRKPVAHVHARAVVASPTEKVTQPSTSPRYEAHTKTKAITGKMAHELEADSEQKTIQISGRKKTKEDAEHYKELQKESDGRKDDERKPVAQAHALSIATSPVQNSATETSSIPWYNVDAKAETKTGQMPLRFEHWSIGAQALEMEEDQMRIEPEKESEIRTVQKEILTPLHSSCSEAYLYYGVPPELKRCISDSSLIMHSLADAKLDLKASASVFLKEDSQMAQFGGKEKVVLARSSSSVMLIGGEEIEATASVKVTRKPSRISLEAQKLFKLEYDESELEMGVIEESERVKGTQVREVEMDRRLVSRSGSAFRFEYGNYGLKHNEDEAVSPGEDVREGMGDAQRFLKLRQESDCQIGVQVWEPFPTNTASSYNPLMANVQTSGIIRKK